eukprot:1102093-Heterocapsa_arctica.AAC.1
MQEVVPSPHSLHAIAPAPSDLVPWPSLRGVGALFHFLGLPPHSAQAPGGTRHLEPARPHLPSIQ